MVCTLTGLSWYHNGSLVPKGSRDQWAWRRGPCHHLHVFSTTPASAGVYAAAAYTATDCIWAFCRVQHKGTVQFPPSYHTDI